MTTKVSPGVANIASQAEAEAGTANNKFMTPERTAQSIAALAATPLNGVDNRVAVFTGANEIEGDANFTWSGTSLSVDGGAVFNESGADVDFRVESDTNTHALFVQGSDGAVGINNSTPTVALDVTTGDTGTDVSSRMRLNIPSGATDGFSQILLKGKSSSVDSVSSITNTKPGALTLGSAVEVVVNEDGNNADFRVESDTLTHAFFVQGSDGNIGVGQSVPNVPFVVGTNPGVTSEGQVASFYSGSNTSVSILSDANVTGSGPRLRLFENNPNKYGMEIFYDSGANYTTFTHYSNSVTSNEFAIKSFETTVNHLGNDVDFRVASNNNANMLFVDGGNDRVGIATATPGSPLDISVASGAFGSTSALRITSVDGGAWGVYPTSAVANPVWNTNVNSGEQFSWSVGGGEVVRIDAFGKVGIACTSPTVALDVVGTGVFSQSSTDTSVLQIVATAGAANRSLDFKTPVDSSDPGYLNDYFSIETGNSIKFEIDANPILRLESNYDVLIGNTPGGDPIMHIDHADSRVGIGTTTPVAPLNIKVGDIGGTLTLANGGREFVIESNETAGITIATPDSSIGQLNFGDPGNSQMGKVTYDHATDRMYFYAGSSSRRRVSIDDTETVMMDATTDFRVEAFVSDYMLFVDASTDRVGIACSAPTVVLDVVGNTHIVGTTLVHSQSNLGFFLGNENILGSFEDNLSNDGSIDLLSVRTSTASTNWTTSQFRLQARVDSTRQSWIGFNGDSTYGGNYGVSIGAGTGGGSLNTLGVPEVARFESSIITMNPNSRDQDFRVESDNLTNALFVRGSDGDVGIGTDSPAQALDVVGTITTSANVHITGSIKDSSGDYGTSGQVLSSTGSGINWISAGSGTVTSTNGANNRVAVFTSSTNIEGDGNFTYDGSNLNLGGSVDAIFNIGTNISTGTAAINVGGSRTGSGYAYIDLVGDTTYTDYGLRLIRNNGGPNTTSALQSRGTGTLDINTIDAGAIQFSTTNTARMSIAATGNITINASGNDQDFRIESSSNPNAFKVDAGNGAGVLFSGGTTDTPWNVTTGNGNLAYRIDNGTSYGSLAMSNNADRGWSAMYINKFAYTSGDDRRYIQWWVNGSALASIQLNSAGTAIEYNTSSDRRLKENIVDIVDGIARVKQLQPKKYTWIGTDFDAEGFIADEADGIVPEAVNGEPNAVDSDGNPIYMQIEYSRYIPLLTAALKETIAKNEELEARIAALESV